MARKTVKRRGQGDGAVRQLKSGKWQARWRDEEGRLRPAPTTFDTKLDAESWLDAEPWLDPDGVDVVRLDPLLRDFAETWLAARDLKPRTRAEYRRMLDQRILPPLGGLRLSRLTSARVRAWFAALDPKKPTSRAHAYSLLKAILTTGTARRERRRPWPRHGRRGRRRPRAPHRNPTLDIGRDRQHGRRPRARGTRRPGVRGRVDATVRLMV